MLARARLKLKNAESSIAFIQEQHTRTLEGLHREIQQLQQKNARLTFELAVHGSSSPKKAPKESCKHAEDLKACRSEVGLLRSALTTCKEEIKFLKQRLFAAEANFSEEVAKRDAKIGQLTAEVERRARIITHITRQLQQMRAEFVRLSEAHGLLQGVGTTVVSTPDHSGCRGTTAVQPPATAVGQIRRRTRRATASALPLNPDTCTEKSVACRSLPTPSASPRPPSSSPPPQRLRHRASGVSSRSSISDTTSHRSSSDLDPVQSHRPPPPSATDLLRNESTLSLTRSSAPVLPPIPANPNLLAAQPQPQSGGEEREGKRRGRRQRLMVKEEINHGKSQAWQELHQSGSD